MSGFPSQLLTSFVSSHNEELWYNKTVRLWWHIYIYIYIYMCVCVCMCVSISIKLAPRTRWQRQGTCFNNYYTEVFKRTLLLSLDYATQPYRSMGRYVIYIYVIKHSRKEHTHAHTHTHINTHTHTHTHTHIYIYICKYTNTHTHTHTHIYIYIYIYIYSHSIIVEDCWYYYYCLRL